MTEMLTQRGVVFWPVGSGDSTTIVVDDETVVQVDLRDMAKADRDDTPEIAVVDRLVEALPRRDGRPYLAVFVLTHADLDHCCRFEDLLSEVTIGELWATPRLWRELEDDPSAEICESARAFHQEAERRVAATRAAAKKGEKPVSGDRVRIIGHDRDGDLHNYADLPDECLSGPGQVVTTLDGVDCTGRFEAFLHAPFKDDCAKARNDTSVAMQVTLTHGDGVGQFLLFGDLAYETVMKIFDYSEAAGRSERLAWDVLLAPHHCSKSVMYVDGDLQLDVLEAIGRNAKTPSTIVSSSNPVPATDTDGANPPHRAAAKRYTEIADDFVCTMEHGSTSAPTPIVFEVDTTGLRLLDPQVVEESARSAAKASGSSLTRLGKVAAAAVLGAAGAYSAERLHRRAAAAGQAPGIDRVRKRVQEQRGGTTAPSGVVGFGR
jgi:beta-lactamase superfamily II metal-dependent hydrolase